MTGKIRSSDKQKPLGGAPKRSAPVVLFRVSKHAKAKRPKPKK
jgi:hypothetical protein